MDVGDLLTLAGKGPDEVVEELVGAVGHDDPGGIEAVEPPRLLPGQGAGRFGVLPEGVTRLRQNGLDDVR